jgi:hypothetical protein
MKITLKNVKYSAIASDETAFFTATIYVDGKREGTACNRGHGGPHEIQPVMLEQRLNAYAATLPPRTITLDARRTFQHQPTGETLISDALSLAFAERELKRLVKNKLLFMRGGVLLESNHLPPATLQAAIANPQEALIKLKADALLNAMPFEEALALYVKMTTA